MKTTKAPRTRLELARVAMEIGLHRYGRGSVTTVTIRHDDWCPMLSDGQICTCEPEFVFTPVEARS